MESHFYFQILLVGLHIGLVGLVWEHRHRRGTACGRAEYLIGKECCPMCAPGTHVKRQCTKFRNTSCIPCTGSTYIDQPNGRTSCFLCRTCHPVSGLKVKQSCTSTSDAVCEPLEGYFCKLPAEFQGCELAQEHSRCKPGQYISQQATSSKDTKCSDCPGDTFSSNGLSTSCQPLTKCESLDQVEVSPGNHSSVTTCKTVEGIVSYTDIEAFVTAAALVIAAVIAGLVFWKCHQSKKRQQQRNEGGTGINWHTNDAETRSGNKFTQHGYKQRLIGGSQFN